MKLYSFKNPNTKEINHFPIEKEARLAAQKAANDSWEIVVLSVSDNEKNIWNKIIATFEPEIKSF